MDVTERQQEVLDYFAFYHQKTDSWPTLRELQAHFGIRSPNGMMCHLTALVKKGRLIHRDFEARAWQLPKNGQPDLLQEAVEVLRAVQPLLFTGTMTRKKVDTFLKKFPRTACAR
jgi:SOS-response transcriptional repressor LexA